MKPKALKERIEYRERYRAGAARLRADCLPLLTHTTWTVERADVVEAGRLRRSDGVVQEFQVIKVYLSAPGTATREAAADGVRRDCTK